MDRAQEEIDRLSQQFGGQSVPAHVTLMGGIVDDEIGIMKRATLLSSLLEVCCPACYVKLRVARHLLVRLYKLF